MKKKIIIAVVVLGLIGGSVILYLFNMPHRDVSSAAIEETVEATVLVKKFLDNPQGANTEYLSQDGESKILAVKGRVNSISEDALGQKVVMLKNAADQMGVSCTFTVESSNSLADVKVGDTVSIKGVIRSGAEYDEDLDLAEDAIMEKCSMI